jgi:hypothetical protein
MASLDMDGPYTFTRDEIHRVMKQSGPGTFALGEQTKDGKFKVRYVGRDDRDVKSALLDALRNEKKPGLMDKLTGKGGGNEVFKVSLAASADAAFDKQCRSYHKFNSRSQLENTEHPEPPAGQSMKCPVCQ